MTTWELLTVAIALAMDALAVAIATGVRLQTVNSRQTFRLAWHFGLFQALMPVAGWAMGLTIKEVVQAWAHWIAFILLLYIGIKMIKEALTDDTVENQCDPTRGLTLIMLSVATSIDALAVGFSLSVLGVSIWYPALIIGIVALCFTALGIHAGKFIGGASRIGRKAELIGGIALILIGCNILRTHGIFG